MLEWFSEFFATLPEVFRALYQFGDPANVGRGWVGLAVMGLWFGALFVLPLGIAKLTYGKREWVSATMGVIAAFSFMWWLHGVLPHAWIQFVQSNSNLLEGTIIPASVGLTLEDGTRIDVASNLYSVITESVLVGLMIAGIAVSIWLALVVQRRLPKTLVSGEEKPEAGGYR
ncbi:MAG: hypothetical protein WD011_02650 [Nitriliruptoraceae bacterium]